MPEDVFKIVGSVIAGAYQVESVVAEGGFGVVYRAHHVGFRAPVALKLLKVPQQNPEQRAEFLELFRAEAELLFRLSASLPTVVRPLHVDAFLASEERFVPYLVMEWLDGLTLDALIKQRNQAGLPPVALRKLVRLLTPVARALERAHNFNGPEGPISIVHRDLKPENIFIAQVAGEEVVKLLDFGIGKVRSAASQVAGRVSQEAPAQMAFTPAFAAPEQWAPRHYGQTGPWTDVWGMALCIVETLAAKQVIDGDPAGMMGVALDPQRRPTPRSEGVKVPDAVEDVFERALALDPRARQRDVGVFWNELCAALAQPHAERRSAGQRAPDTRAPRIELLELPTRPPPAAAARPQASGAGQALALDLEFDPSSVPSRSLVLSTASAASAPFVALLVPDLELEPPPVSWRASGARPIEAPERVHTRVLDLDEPPAASPSLDLDLPWDEPISRRAVSLPRVPSTQLSVKRPSTPPTRESSGAHSAARASTPPLRPDSTPISTRAALRARDPLPAMASSNLSSPLPMPPPLSSAKALDSARARPSATLPFDFGSVEERTLVRRLRYAFVLLGVAILVAILDPVYAAVSGQVLEVLGLRLSGFAGALLVLALGVAAREALREV